MDFVEVSDGHGTIYREPQAAFHRALYARRLTPENVSEYMYMGSTVAGDTFKHKTTRKYLPTPGDRGGE